MMKLGSIKICFIACLSWSSLHRSSPLLLKGHHGTPVLPLLHRYANIPGRIRIVTVMIYGASSQALGNVLYG